MTLLHVILLGCLLFFSSQLVSANTPTDVELCGQFESYNSTITPFSYNNNAWGNSTNSASGSQCFNLKNGGKSATVTYQWSGDATIMKGYPYMRAHPSNFPAPLSSITRLSFAGNWSTTVTQNQISIPGNHFQAYSDPRLRANIAIDMFLGDNATSSAGSNPPVEVMIWPWWTPTVWPLGWDDSTPNVDVVEIDGTSFSLYRGQNDDGQKVYSWLAQQNLTSADSDYFPLLQYLCDKGMISNSMWIGLLEFGTEIMYAPNQTIFETNDMVLEIERQDKGAGNSSSSTAASSSTSTLIPSASTLASSEAASTSATGTRHKSEANQEVIVSWVSFVLLFVCVLFI